MDEPLEKLQVETHEEAVAEAVADRRRGRRVRQLMNLCWEKPSIPLFFILYVTLGWHPAMQKMGLEPEPSSAAAVGNDLRVDVQRLIDAQKDLRHDVAGIHDQLQTLQQDVVDLALRHSNAAAGGASTVAQVVKP